MAKVEIDTPGVTIRVEDANADAKTLAAQALVLYQEASELEKRQPPGSTNGLQAERRSTPNLGFGTWHHEAKPPEASHP